MVCLIHAGDPFAQAMPRAMCRLSRLCLAHVRNQFSAGREMKCPVTVSPMKLLDGDETGPPEGGAMCFIGVTTGASLSNRLFPYWTRALGVAGPCRLVGIDLPLGASPQAFRQVVVDLRGVPDIRGALVTSHKISLLDASRDLFDRIDDTSAQSGEVGCITVRGGRLTALALDPLTSALAMDQFVPPAHWARHLGSRVLCFGAGGAGTAIGLGLATRTTSANVPSHFLIVDRVQTRVDHAVRVIREAVQTNGSAMTVEGCVVRVPSDCDALVDALSPRSLVINATGMGKDTAGSPVTASVRFPDHGLVWDLNYRGERLFLQYAQSADQSLGLVVVDGWDYFAVSWTEHLARIYGMALSPDLRRKIVAGTIRP